MAGRLRAVGGGWWTASGGDAGFDPCQGTPFGSRRKRGAEIQAIGRSRGGRTTKIHAAVDEHGRARRLIVGAGHRGDAPMAARLIGAMAPGLCIADTAYDSDALRDLLLDRGTIPVIPNNITLRVSEYRYRQGELDARLRDLEERIWKFSELAEEYWRLDSADERASGLETAMKHLSTRIGHDISHLNATYTSFSFKRNETLIALRQAAMGSPFEENSRQPEAQRGGEIRLRTSALVDALSAARRRRWRL